MNLHARKTVLALLTSLTLVGLTTSTDASEPSALLLPPHKFPLPKFCFGSYNIQGVGDRVTNVRWGGLASRMGLEPGDTILSLNGHPLRYHGAWNNALREAMHDGGFVRLRVRDVRTGHVAFRQIHVGGAHGPVTPKSHVAGYPNHSPHADDYCEDPHYDHGYPNGPITQKSKVGPFSDGKFNGKFGKKFDKNFEKKFDKKHNKKFDGPKDFNKSVKKFAKLFGDKD